MAKKVNKNEPKVSNTNIEYEGQVIIKLQKGNNIYKKTIHNIGTLNLFYGIALSLISSENEVKNKFLPNYLGAGEGTSTDISADLNRDDLIQTVGTRVKVTNKNISRTATGALVTLIGVLSNLGAGTAIKELGLFGDKISNSLLARIQLNEPIIINEGVSLIVEWTMSIQNK